ncbi:MAG: alpha/beta hydrolase [Actinomycetota bacterium]
MAEAALHCVSCWNMELPEPVCRWRDAGRFVEIDGRNIFVIEAGHSGPHVMILHGFPSSSYEWHSVVQTLALNARVVLFDFPGYGLSDKPLDPRVTLFEIAGCAERVAEMHGIEHVTLIAHDVGDTVAAEMLSRHNAGRLGFSIDRTVLCNGSIFIDMAELSPGQRLLLQLPDEPLASPLPLDGFRDGIAATFSPDHPASDEAIDAMITLIAHNDGDRTLPRLIRYIEERRRYQQRWTDALVQYTNPLTLVWGEQDPIALVAMTDRLRALRPSTEIVTWSDVSHWPATEVPERLAAEIIARLDL